MTRSRTSSRLRWAAPVVAVATVAGVVALSSATASAQDLPPRSAAELLADLAAPTTDALSGTVVQTSRLGLPELPGATAGTGPMSLTSGSNTLRVWVDGPERSRVALLGELDEYDVVRNGSDVWTYSAAEDEAVHVVLPERADGAAGRAPVELPEGLPSTPAEAAEAALAAIDPTTEVAVDESVTVAGRPARQLVLTPEQEGTLVGSVRLAVDAETSVPLRVQVYSAADAENPAFEVGFTDVSLQAPDASVFTFTPPPGAEVREETPTPGSGAAPSREGAGVPDGGSVDGGAVPEVVGTGWTSVLVADLGEDGLGYEQSALLDQLSTPVDGGRLITTALVSVLLTDDGRVLLGAVTPEVLQAAA